VISSWLLQTKQWSKRLSSGEEGWSCIWLDYAPFLLLSSLLWILLWHFETQGVCVTCKMQSIKFDCLMPFPRRSALICNLDMRYEPKCPNGYNLGWYDRHITWTFKGFLFSILWDAHHPTSLHKEGFHIKSSISQWMHKVDGHFSFQCWMHAMLIHFWLWWPQIGHYSI
jgi:hypothetical protein